MKTRLLRRMSGLALFCAVSGCATEAGRELGQSGRDEARPPARTPAQTPEGDGVGAGAPGAPVGEGPAAPAVSTEVDPLHLGPKLEEIRARYGVPSLAVAAFRGGKPLERAVVGVRKAGDTTLATLDDTWHLGSCTKAMTATLVAMLVDEGKLGWTDTLGALFAGQGIDSRYASVTVEMLLEHRSGMPRSPDNASSQLMYDDGVAGKPPAQTRAKAVLNTLRLPPGGPTGTYSYSNAGYMTAGVILEKKANVAWESLIRSRLFVPLGMTSCGFGPPATYPSSVDEPWGHVEETSGAETPVAPGPASDNPPSIGPAGYVHCSLVDWGKFLGMHARGARGETTLVSVASMARLHAPPPTGESYAAGWYVTTRPWATGNVFTHTGSNSVFWAATWIAPADDLVIVSATNAGGDKAGGATDEALVPLVQAYGVK